MMWMRMTMASRCHIICEQFDGPYADASYCKLTAVLHLWLTAQSPPLQCQLSSKW